MKTAIACSGILMLMSCNGVFDEIYDKPIEIIPAKGEIVVDATSWTDWYYIDLQELQRLTEQNDEEALIKAQTVFQAYPIPMTLTGESDDTTGQYLYWFDVFGKGVENNEYRSFTPTDKQPEPDRWTIAVHRNNVRTNGGEVYETAFTSMDQLPESSAAFANVKFSPDEWSECDVWDSQEQMLLGLVPSQGMKINKLLSSWLALKIPPMPPAYVKNNHVFILRLSDGTCAALQLEDYLSPSGKKCYLTINYKYPY